jgi:phage terminase small subunit
MKKLTEKQEKFAQAYVVTGNASEAYRKAYKVGKIKSETVNKRASELINNGYVKGRIKELQEQRLKRTEVDADYVLKRLIQIDEMDVMDILDNTGNILPVKEWPKSWRTTLSGLDIQELMQGDTQSIIRKIKWPDKLRNLELLGKHIDIQAFKEQMKVDGEVDLISPLVAARKRLEQRK